MRRPARCPSPRALSASSSPPSRSLACARHRRRRPAQRPRRPHARPPDGGRACTESAALAAAGARGSSPELRLWRLDGRTATLLLPGLRARDAVAFAPARAVVPRRRDAPTRPTRSRRTSGGARRSALADLTPPGPGIPVTIVDSGIDVTHPEFAGRADTHALNAQEPAPRRRRARHRRRIARRRAGQRRRARRDLPASRPALLGRRQGPGHAARVERDRRRASSPRRAAGTSVINLSLGSDTRDLVDRAGGREAVATGLARRRRLGQRRRARQPARLSGRAPARDDGRRDGPVGRGRAFSSRSRYVDLAAPGDDIIVASALGKSWRPLVRHELLRRRSSRARRRGSGRLDPSSTAGQVSEVLRRSARDLGAPGRDRHAASGC